jgi:hypothetical protein
VNSSFHAAQGAYSAAVRAFLALDQAEVEAQANRLIIVLAGTVDWETVGWLLNSRRMRMFFACERRDVAAVSKEVEEIIEMMMGEEAGTWLPTYAINWARAWSDEIKDDYDKALWKRENACVRGEGRAVELAEADEWLPWERSEAQLLVDVFTDLLRTARICSSPDTALDRINRRFRDPSTQNTYIDLAQHRAMGGWSQRRALLRVVYELADREDGGQPYPLKVRRQLLDRIERLDVPRDCALARLDQPMIKVEKHFASNITGTPAAVVEALRDEAEAHADSHGLRRRSEMLRFLWPRITRHGKII